MTYITFARWFGIISVILSLGVLFNLKDARAMAKHMIEDESGYVMGGVLPIIFGSLALMHQNSFVAGWPLLVTVIGLLMMAAGIFRVMFVKQWRKFLHRHVDVIPALYSLFGLIFGLLLLYVGFVSQIVGYHNPLLALFR